MQYMDAEQLIESQKRIELVVRQMKEIPELPSEAPKDVQNLQNVILLTCLNLKKKL